MFPKNTYALALGCWLLAGLCFGQTPPVLLPTPDRAELIRADDRADHTRFSAPVPVDLAPASAPTTYRYEAGEWTWSQTFRLPGATGLGAFVDRVNLPAGGRLTWHNAAGRRGPFRQADASTLGRLFTDFLPGEAVTLTYRGPLPDEPPFHVWRVDHVYRPDRWADPFAKDFGDANDCHVGANCPPGDGWADQKAGTARVNLVVAEGVGFCSGNLINNTAADGRPYLLTGFHCMDGFTPLYDLWAVDFDYVGAACAAPQTEPTPVRYVGVTQRAGWRETDFLLLEITDPTFADEDHFFAGWDRSGGNVSGPVTHFHHPFGDVQMIGVSGNAGMSVLNTFITWNSGVVTPSGHHFRLLYETGTFQIGSSGSAYFDAARRIRGTLNGGNASCPGTSEAFVGRFHLSWAGGGTDSTSLAPWLDPLDSGAQTYDGANLLTKRFATGRVLLGDEPLAGATVTLAWPGGEVSYQTDATGRYYGERPAAQGAFAVTGSYGADDPRELGVDVGDLIQIRRHILNQVTLPPAQQLAADVNGSGTIRVSDITRTTRVILSIDDWGARPNYLVVPVGFPLDPLPADPAAPIGIALNNRAVNELTIDFFVVKTGDADGNIND